MPHEKYPSAGRAVPASRLSRLIRFGGLATGVAGGMLLDGISQFAQGRRPSLGDLLLTPSNAIKITHQLSQLRGAAMKVGQLLSMDAGDVLPPELTGILARLRDDAQPMPQAQLRQVLRRDWGADWQNRLEKFDFDPIAAASIGQVHRARTRDGREIAIKIQYPGVRDSIDSDVGNVAALIRLSGLLPSTSDLAPVLAEARRQLHAEADYAREGAYLLQFGKLLAASPEFVVPELHPDFTSSNVLAMSYLEGAPLEALATAPQAERDRIMTLLIGLVLRELFAFNLMQTDPNFANYRYNTRTGQLVLLDFGATRAFPATMAQDYRRLLQAGLARDRDGVRDAAIAIGFFAARTPQRHQHAVLALVEMALAPLRFEGAFDFGRSDLARRLRDGGMAIAAERDFVHVPPMDMLFLQRKVGGMFLLASQLKARVNIRAQLAPFL
ncbi:MAG TPA: AarF/ABC1/UbiB kinase family protein [Steroidobacteraceae bacterium]